MTNPWIVTAATVTLIVLSAFFVVIEFALIGARRHRLEEAAETNRSARAALKGMNELTVMLAAAQFGITACTFALGAVTKPALDKSLAPLLDTWGLPSAVADISSFIVSLLVVTFLHLVVGEMAPKSWAIAHPETAAKAIGIPARVLVAALRPLLLWINSVANRLVAASGITPVDRAAIGGRDADTIRQLVELSARAGTLEGTIHEPITTALSFESLTLADLVPDQPVPTAVPADSSVAKVQRAASASGHLRILIIPENTSAPPAVVHVRDTLLADTDAPAGNFAREAYALDASTPVHSALIGMRRAGEQLTVVLNDEQLVGVITLTDLLNSMTPSADLTNTTEP